MPETAAREAILRTATERGNAVLSPDVDLSAIAAASEGLSGADLQALMATAQLAAVHRHLEDGQPVCITPSILSDARASLRPSVSHEVSNCGDNSLTHRISATTTTSMKRLKMV